MKLTVFTSFADQMTEDARHYIQNLGNCIQNFGVLSARIGDNRILNRYARLSTHQTTSGISSTVIVAIGPKEKAGENLRPF